MINIGPGDCPSREDFIRALGGEIGEESHRRFFRHVRRCPCCRPKLQILQEIKTELETRERMVPETGLTGKEARALRRVALQQLRQVKPPAVKTGKRREAGVRIP